TRGTPFFDVAASERQVAALRSFLGEEQFTVAWEQGRAMTVEQAVAEAERVCLPEPAMGSAETVSQAPPAEAYPAGLTEREVEVLRPVTHGLTPAQVADQLVISPVTVSTHLRNIYAKIGVNSRAAATRWAVEQGLV